MYKITNKFVQLSQELIKQCLTRYFYFKKMNTFY